MYTPTADSLLLHGAGTLEGQEMSAKTSKRLSNALNSLCLQLPRYVHLPACAAFASHFTCCNLQCECALGMLTRWRCHWKQSARNASGSCCWAGAACDVAGFVMQVDTAGLVLYDNQAKSLGDARRYLGTYR